MVIVENNKYAYSTPTYKQTANTRFVDRAKAYGCLGERRWTATTCSRSTR